MSCHFLLQGIFLTQGLKLSPALQVVDKYVHKGSQLYIEGRLRSREWEQDGQKRYATEIVADEMKLLGRRQDNAPQQSGYQGGYQQPQYQQPAQPQYQQPAQPQYQQPQYQPTPQPVAPAVPAEDPDDLPF